MDKEEELKSAKFFINWLNKKYNFDYEAILNNNENIIDREIDVYAKSKLSKFLQLNLQIITSQGRMRALVANLMCQSKKTRKRIVYSTVKDLNSVRWIIDAIKKKEDKYAKDAKKTLVLLIQKDIGPRFNEEYFYKIFYDFRKSDFRGIYLIHTPALKIDSTDIHDGQILTIKDIIN